MKKPQKPRAPRRVTLGFEKHSKNLPAVVDGKFLGAPGTIVWAWRERGGWRPSWYRCQVVRVAEKHVELWDEVAGQWFCYDPTAERLPDVRLSG
jgi:hypothetical protein